MKTSNIVIFYRSFRLFMIITNQSHSDLILCTCLLLAIHVSEKFVSQIAHDALHSSKHFIIVDGLATGAILVTSSIYELVSRPVLWRHQFMSWSRDQYCAAIPSYRCCILITSGAMWATCILITSGAIRAAILNINYFRRYMGGGVTYYQTCCAVLHIL